MLSRDDIIEMAREAGLLPCQGIHPGDLERFARAAYAAGAAAERDRMISEGWRQCAQGQKTTQHCAVAEQARQEEREACAIAGGAAADAGLDVAAAIRARGQA